MLNLIILVVQLSKSLVNLADPLLSAPLAAQLSRVVWLEELSCSKLICLICPCVSATSLFCRSPVSVRVIASVGFLLAFSPSESIISTSLETNFFSSPSVSSQPLVVSRIKVRHSPH